MLLMEGLKLTIIGMTVVFVFLSLLVVLMLLMNRFLIFFNRYFPEQEVSVQTATSGNDEHIAAIIAAVQAFKNK